MTFGADVAARRQWNCDRREKLEICNDDLLILLLMTAKQSRSCAQLFRDTIERCRNCSLMVITINNFIVGVSNVKRALASAWMQMNDISRREHTAQMSVNFYLIYGHCG